MKVQFYAKKPAFRRKQWRARFVSSAHITFVSSESYNNLRDVESAVLTLELPDRTPVEYPGYGTSSKLMATTMGELRAMRVAAGFIRFAKPWPPAPGKKP